MKFSLKDRPPTCRGCGKPLCKHVDRYDVDAPMKRGDLIRAGTVFTSWSGKIEDPTESDGLVVLCRPSLRKHTISVWFGEWGQWGCGWFHGVTCAARWAYDEMRRREKKR